MIEEISVEVKKEKKKLNSLEYRSHSQPENLHPLNNLEVIPMQGKLDWCIIILKFSVGQTHVS